MITYNHFVIITLSFLLILSSCKNETNKKEDVIHKANATQIKSEADFFYNKNNYPRAIILFNELIASDSLKGEYYYKRGVAYSMILNAGQAIKDFLKAIELGYRKGEAYQNIGANYSTINDSLAIYYLNKSLQINPDNAKAKRIIRECTDRLNRR